MKRLTGPKGKKGAALVSVILLMVVAAILSVAVVTTTVAEVNMVSLEQKTTRAYYVAHSAVDTVSNDVIKKIHALETLAAHIKTTADSTAYETERQNFYATYVPQSGTYTHTISIPDELGTLHSVQVAVTRSSSTASNITTAVITFSATATIENKTATASDRIKTTEKQAAAEATELLWVSNIFDAPLIASQNITLLTEKSLLGSNKDIKLQGSASVAGYTDPATIYNLFGIMVEQVQGLSYTLNLPPDTSITPYKNSDINTTKDGKYFSFSGNFNNKLKITGIRDMDVYLMNSDVSFDFNGSGYFATNSSADVFVIALNATSINLSGNYLTGIPSGYNPASLYIYAPNANVHVGASFNGMIGSIFGKNIYFENFVKDAGSQQYTITYKAPSGDPGQPPGTGGGMTAVGTTSIYFTSFTFDIGSKVWLK